MQRLTPIYLGVNVLVIVTILLVACGGNTTPGGCLDRSDSERWLKDVGALLAVWNDEVDLVSAANRGNAALASRELRNIRRELRQMDTPDCLTPMRERILYQMSGVLASLDAWIREDGKGFVFSTAGELYVDDFRNRFLTDGALAIRCRGVLDAGWIQETQQQLSDWEWQAGSVRDEFRIANAKAIMTRLEQESSSDCAKAAVLSPVLEWMRAIQTVGRNVEDVDSIFLEIVNEYIDLRLQDSP